MKKPFEPNFQTPDDQLSKEELNKLSSGGADGPLKAEFEDSSKPDIIWEAEQIAKSYGIYMEFDRAKSGKEKDWVYMIRVSNPGGGPINRDQWLAMDELAEKYCVDPQGNSSIRLTTRQNIQFHWIPKNGVIPIVKTMAERGLLSLNGCGDNTRNVMGCPCGRHSDVFDATEWAHKVGDYFQLPVEPFIKIFAIDPQAIRKPGESYSYGPKLLNRKFKIGFSAVHKDPATGEYIPENCVELLTNDMAAAPIVENGKLVSFQVYIGGGQGERNGKPSMAALAKPFAIVSPEQLLPVMDAVVKTHEEWGDRQNRHWARIKYVVKKQGIDWFREQVSQRVGFPLQRPNPDHDYGRRSMHHGWWQQPKNGKWTFGAYIENGRLTDAGPNGKLKSMVREAMSKYDIQIMVTANQDILFTDLEEKQKDEFLNFLESFGFGKRNGKSYSTLRKLSGACVGRDTCRLTYTDSEKFEPVLLDELEELGWGDIAESIGITGCERQCFRPSTKTIGLVGSGLNRYQVRLFGTESGKEQGRPLIDSKGENIYLRSVPRDEVQNVIDTLFKFYQSSAQGGEEMGEFHHRVGPDAIIDHLKSNEKTASLMEKPFNTDCVID